MKQIALGQWNEFCDRFGLPGLLGTAPDGASQASREELLKLLANWSTTVAAVLPPGYAAQFANAVSSGSMLPARDMVEYCEEGMSVLWMGGNLSTKSQSGSGTLAGGAQRDQEIEMTQDDANDLAGTINAQLCAPAVRFQFDQRLMCQFRFKFAQTIDLAASIEVDVALVNDLGLEIAEADLRAKYGWRKPEANEETVKKQAPVAGAGGAGSDAPLPKAPSLRSEASGDGGTALKAGHGEVEKESHPADAVAAAHLEAGRTAMKALFERMQSAVDDVIAAGGSPADLEKKLKALKFDSKRLQKAFRKVIEGGLKTGTTAVETQMAAGSGGGA